ncbi:MAG TPA: hypothetical protein VG692_09870 [Gemmatimonadales bacterium]|nr:hypothetical protein [Gemmatimonadales bacterium]
MPDCLPEIQPLRGTRHLRWRSFAIRDGNLVTGKQNFSGAETARAIVAALGE